MRTFSIALATAVACGLTLSSIEAARDQDIDLFMKWSGADIVHYDVVGEYSAPTIILRSAGGLPGKWSGSETTVVKDRFDISFDWNPRQNALVGKPVFKNSAAIVAAGFLAGACRQPPPLTGSYEHLDIVDVKLEVGDLLLASKRTFPAGSVPLLNEVGVCGLHPVSATTQTLTHRLPILPGNLFAKVTPPPTNTRAGEDGGPTRKNQVLLGADGKTMVLDDGERGWKYIYTLRIAK